MELLIVRHGVAEDKDAFARTGKSDDKRPLTDKGRKKMKRASRGLCAIVPQIGLLVSSPLTRARETAAYVAGAYDIDVSEVAEVLRPESTFEEFVEWLRPRAATSPVCIVGHEPHLSGLATWLTSGSKESRMELTKGGACLLTFDGPPKKAGATLSWLLTSKQLEALGEA
jgi:phosphohistidine phosphatase